MKPSCDVTGEVHASENIFSRGCEEMSDVVEKDNLWLLLQLQALHKNSFEIGDDKSKWLLEIMCFKTGNTGWPNLWCQLKELVLTLEKVRIGIEVDAVRDVIMIRIQPHPQGSGKSGSVKIWIHMLKIADPEFKN